MKYKVSFESASGCSGARSDRYNGLLVKEMGLFSEMFEDGIRVNVGDIIYLERLEDLHNGYYGEELSKMAFEWSGELDGGEIIKCCWVEIIPRHEGLYIDVVIGLENPK